jgi:hypothetical protein
MKTILFITLLLIALPLTTVFAEPEIAFDQKSFDFGSVVAGKSVEHVFEFTNKGNSDLVINKVKAT